MYIGLVEYAKRVYLDYFKSVEIRKEMCKQRPERKLH